MGFFGDAGLQPKTNMTPPMIMDWPRGVCLIYSPAALLVAALGSGKQARCFSSARRHGPQLMPNG
jgi:hypothetical protein